MAGNVNLIDPNNSNINPDIVNGIPQYQDMYISADLVAISRGRTVLATTVNGDITKLQKTGLENERIVSFLGQNQDLENSAHFNQFTTNWYDGASDVDKTYEGFGISNIDIIINSSFIPQINIEFVDIRGLAFFNRENSPYRILFDFPPPIFYLTFKGYYGKAITYQMHLVKYTTTFKAETGNYHIDAQFIAITYAPLTDILFRYIVQAPLMDEDNPVTLSPDTSEPPQNTLDLILKIEQVYSEIPEKLKTDVDNKKYESAQKKLGEFSNTLSVLANFKEDSVLSDLGNPQIFTYDNTPDSDTQGEIKTINSFVEYDEYLKTFQTSDLTRDIPKKLYVGYFLDRNDDGVTDTTDRNQTFKKTLDEYKNRLINKTKSVALGISASDIEDASFIADERGAEKIKEALYLRYVGLNITEYYTKLYKGRIKLEIEKNDSMNALNQTINNMIQQRLGMTPTIYNVFEILLNDVDTFFNVLRKTATEAEDEHHVKFKNQILNDGNYKDVSDKIYAFPLVVRQEKVCNQIKEVRVAPIDISQRLDQPFPELKLVQNFIDSFITYNRIYTQATLKDDKTAQGDYKWLPFTPADSRLITPTLHSPYFGTDSPGGGSFQQPINVTEATRLDQIFEKFIKRFYVLSQNSLAYSFYNDAPPKNSQGYYLYDINPSNDTASKAYIKLYAQAEAINLANSLTNEHYADLLKRFASLNKRTTSLNDPANGFYTYLNRNLLPLYTESAEFYDLSNGEDLYRNKLDSSYNGLGFTPMSNIATRTGTENDDFELFVEDSKRNFWQKIKGVDKDIESTFLFTQENLVLRTDTTSVDNANNKKYTPHKTKFLINDHTITKSRDGTRISFYDPTEVSTGYGAGIYGAYEAADNSFPYNPTINDLANTGNQFFFNNAIEYGRKIKQKEKHYTNITTVWVNMLSQYDDEMKDVIIDTESSEYDARLAALVYLSNFGYTLSAFNYYPFFLNKDYFSTPSIVEMPTFVKLYMGLLVGIEKNDAFWDKIKNFFATGAGRFISSGGALIFADIYDINTYLSENDKSVLRSDFENWFVSDFPSMALSIESLYNKVQEDFASECPDFRIIVIPIGGVPTVTVLKANRRAYRCKSNLYELYLDADSKKDSRGNDYYHILDDMIERVGLICFNELTFRFETDITPPLYTPLKTIVEEGTTRSTKTDDFFAEFFTTLESKVQTQKKNLTQETQEFKNSTGDEDIMTQTYYSFKNINDKWLAGLNKNVQGYPFKTDPVSGLISQFAFVDRAMNPIGDTIIDLRSLIDARNSPDTSIFTVITQLLSLNGFEFFPLQNFLNFEEYEWRESFEIDTGNLQKQFPVFVCMYIGGASSYPSGIEQFSPFEDDGIVDLENPGVGDFLNEGCAPDPVGDRQTETATNTNMYSRVRAFKVRYGEQNQNMFYDFAIDSKEYPETNESIQILSRLAGDEGASAPVPKAQNLYSLYENRAYKATVTGLGNAMIQPTQYFQLENVPLFNGAYIILTVEHHITPNKMSTQFSGTKLLKYPMPRVLNPAAIVGFEGGSTTETNPSAASNQEITAGVSAAGNPDQTLYNSMYIFEIN